MYGIKFSSDQCGNEADRFKILSENISDFFSELNIPVSPYNDINLPHYRNLPLESQRQAVYYLELFSQTLNNSRNGVTNFKNNADSLWDAMKIFGLRPNSDMFKLLQADDKIEIYTNQGIQIWRNFNMMRVCSYTLEEIYCFTWDKRYDRAESDTVKILEVVQKVMAPENKSNISAFISAHQVTEKFSASRFALEARHDHFCPLFDGSDRSIAFAVTSKVRILSSNLENGKETEQRKLYLLPNLEA